MPNKKIKKEDEVDEVDGMDDSDITSEDEEEQSEVLPGDVQDALGMNKREKAAKMEIDYISELENDIDDFDTNDQKGGFGDDFSSELE
jgi:hypothetical protein